MIFGPKAIVDPRHILARPFHTALRTQECYKQPGVRRKIPRERFDLRKSVAMGSESDESIR